MLRVPRQLYFVLIKITECALQVPGSHFLIGLLADNLCSSNLYIETVYIIAGL